MEGMNESYSHSMAEQRLSNFSHPKISLDFEFLYVFNYYMYIYVHLIL
jgi:hypothetical protein